MAADKRVVLISEVLLSCRAMWRAAEHEGRGLGFINHAEKDVNLGLRHFDILVASALQRPPMRACAFSLASCASRHRTLLTSTV